ncbi:ankyrin repeat-containing domain protein [Flagelloscypha sp. PMI_526]|nr:ankyrin repeat-containing domain protein [Flagelloscypha sp. PMI_526]
MVRGTWNKLRSTFTSLGTEGSSEPFISFKSLKQAEKDLLAPSSSKAFDFGLRGHLVCSAVDWLWNLSGDTSIQEVIALTLHGFFWGSPSSPWLPINRSNVITYVSNFIPLHAILDTAFKRFFDSFKDDNTAGNARTWFSLFTILERDAQGIYSSWSRQNYWSSMIAPSSAQYVVKYAVRYGRLQFLTSVMQRDDVAELDKARARENEESFLHIASAAGHVDVVKLLLERGADIINGVERDDALVAAVMMGHLEIIKAFIAHHRVSSPAFFAALRKGNPDIVEAFLSGADLEKLDPNHEALQFACSQPEISLPIIRQLVFGGADLTRGGVQVLGGASYVGDLELVSHLIINRGVDPNTNDTSGVYDNALQAACDNNQP